MAGVNCEDAPYRLCAVHYGYSWNCTQFLTGTGRLYALVDGLGLEIVNYCVQSQKSRQELRTVA